MKSFSRTKVPEVLHKTEASYQHLLLELMSNMVKQQKETNDLQKKNNDLLQLLTGANKHSFPEEELNQSKEKKLEPKVKWGK